MHALGMVILAVKMTRLWSKKRISTDVTGVVVTEDGLAIYHVSKRNKICLIPVAEK